MKEKSQAFKEKAKIYGTSAMSATLKGVNKASTFAKEQYAKRRGTEIEKAQPNPDFHHTSGNQQRSIGGSRESGEQQKSLPGKVGIFAGFIAAIVRGFTKFTTWVAARLFGSVFAKKKFSFWRMKKVKSLKDRFLSKIAIFVGGILGVIIFFKSLKYYVKNRTLRKKDAEIARLRDEIRELKEDLDKEIKDYRKEVRSLK